MPLRWGRLHVDQQEALRKLQQAELDTLLVVARFCQDNGIAWFLDSGSALGACRHEGFIPWDDDIDIGMLRPDYDRFCELAERGLPEGFSLHTSRNTHGYAGLFAKVYKDGTRFETQETREAGCEQGIFIDVFPYDRLPRDKGARKRVISGAAWAQRLSYLYYAKTITVPHRGGLGMLERLACRAAHHVVRLAVREQGRLQDEFDRVAACTGSELGDECLSLVWPYMKPVSQGTLVPPSTATFEGHELPVPCKPEAYLENMYGDWRKIPAPEERHTHLPLLLDFGDGTRWESAS